MMPSSKSAVYKFDKFCVRYCAKGVTRWQLSSGGRRCWCWFDGSFFFFLFGSFHSEGLIHWEAQCPFCTCIPNLPLLDARKKQRRRRRKRKRPRSWLWILGSSCSKFTKTPEAVHRCSFCEMMSMVFGCSFQIFLVAVWHEEKLAVQFFPQEVRRWSWGWEWGQNQLMFDMPSFKAQNYPMYDMWFLEIVTWCFVNLHPWGFPISFSDFQGRSTFLL